MLHDHKGGRNYDVPRGLSRSSALAHANHLSWLQALWGDYAYQPKTKRIMRIKGKTDAKPLFVQLALEPLWKAYAAVSPGADSKVRGV